MKTLEKHIEITKPLNLYFMLAKYFLQKHGEARSKETSIISWQTDRHSKDDIIKITLEYRDTQYDVAIHLHSLEYIQHWKLIGKVN